jgi:plastocyanin
MRKYLILMVVGLAGVAASHAGTIAGTVRALPPPGPPDQSGSGAYESRRYKFADKIDYDHVRDFVVYIDQPVPGPAAAAPQLAAVTTQKDASFDPHVLPIAVGTTVRWPNEDDIYHNVYSDSDVKQFDLKFYKKERVPEVKFDQVGRVDVFCAIHTKMHCVVLVLPNTYFATADAKGRFVIKDVPAGTYKLRAWHERLPSQTKEIAVPADGEVRVDFVLGLGELPKY